MKRTVIIAALAVAVGLLSSPGVAGFGDSDQMRSKRWKDLQTAIFGARTVVVDAHAIKIDAPERALDAAIVPLAITIADPKDVKALYLVIDDNPSPLAAHFTFGDGADPRRVALRVRIDAFTDLHAVAEMKDGRLVSTSSYVKASGGCSAPMGMSDDEAMQGIGTMKLKLAGDLVPGEPKTAVLMIRHPNFNGMQMNADTRAFTPARYIQAVDVTLDGHKVFDLASDISLASNPVLTFDVMPDKGAGTLAVDVRDSQGGTWSRSFALPTPSN